MGTPMNIGQWVMREKRQVGHLVESTVAGDAITRCGRRMAERNTRGGLVEAPFGTPKCGFCIGAFEKERSA